MCPWIRVVFLWVDKAELYREQARKLRIENDAAEGKIEDRAAGAAKKA